MVKGLILRCQECSGEWHFKPPMGMPMAAFLSRLGGESVCPFCGASAKKVMLLGGEQLEAAAARLGVPWLEGEP